MSTAKVDIYMPVYKPHRDHLRAAVQSVFDQNEQDWQLHINDQKTDVDVRSFIEDFLADERVHFHTNTDHPGIGANWNDCLKYGDAPVIQYMFQDDIWKNDYLSVGLRVLADNPGVGMVSMGHEYVFEGDIPTQNSYQELQDFLKWNVSDGHHNGLEFLMWWLEKGLHPNVIGEPMFVMLRRETVQKTGLFREDMNQNLDSEYWARVLLNTDWFLQSGVYGTFRVHGDSASMKNYEAGRGIFDRFMMMKTVVSLLPPQEKKRAKRMMNMHLVLMMQKFVERYGKKHIHVREQTTPASFLTRNFPVVIRAGISFLKRKSRS